MKNFYFHRKILITGHTSFCGTWLSLILKHLGATVLGISSDYPSKPSMFIETDLDDFIISEFGDLRDFGFLKNKISSFQPDIIIYVSESFRYVTQPEYSDFFRNSHSEIFNLLQLSEICTSRCLLLNLTPDFSSSMELYDNNFEDKNIVNVVKNSAQFTESLITSYRGSSSFSEGNRNPFMINFRINPVIGGGDWSLLNPVHATERFKNSNELKVTHILDALSGVVRFIKSKFDCQTNYINDLTLDDFNHMAAENSFDKLKGMRPYIDLETAIKMYEDWFDARRRGANMRAYTLSQITAYFQME